jgi:hypothetical protein
LAINWLAIEANRVSPPRMSNLVWALLFAYLAGMALWLGLFVRHFFRVPGEQTA